jgi:uncharacterized membrane protein
MGGLFLIKARTGIWYDVRIVNAVFRLLQEAKEFAMTKYARGQKWWIVGFVFTFLYF